MQGYNVPSSLVCEIHSLILREKQRLRVLQNRVMYQWLGGYLCLRGSSRWLEKWNNDGLHDLYSSPNVVWLIKSRRMRLVVHVTHME